jgi:single-strand DNA-binding protein
MANLNRVFLIGNCTRDPEMRHTPKGTAVAELGLAINRVIPASEEGGERREEVTFVDVTIWGRQAEVAQQYLTKGKGVFIEGRLQLDTWDDKQSGQKRSKMRVVCENLQLLGSGPGRQENAAESPVPARATASAGRSNGRAGAPASKRPQPARDPDLDAEPDDIPFKTTVYRDVRNNRLNRRIF